MRATKLAALALVLASLWQGTPVSGSSADATLPAPDRAAPSGKILFSSEDFAPSDDKDGSRLIVTIQASSSVARIVSWDLTVYDPGAMPFASFKGEWPQATVAWDGRGDDGELVESASRYAFVARIRDSLGQVGEARGTLATGIVMLKGGSRYRIGISSIVFKPDSADFKDVEPGQQARNLETPGSSPPNSSDSKATRYGSKGTPS
jgi:hypothetical protein